MKDVVSGQYLLGLQLGANAFDGKDSANINKYGHDNTGRFIPYVGRSSDGTIWNRFRLPERTVLPEAQQTGEAWVMDRTNTKTDGEGCLHPYTVPITKGGKFLGVVGQDILVDTLIENQDITIMTTVTCFLSTRRAPSSSILTKSPSALRIWISRRVFGGKHENAMAIGRRFL